MDLDNSRFRRKFRRKRRRRTRFQHLNVVKGNKQNTSSLAAIPGISGLNQKAICYILFFLALFLLSQILFGWVWGAFKCCSAQVTRVGEGTLDVSFPTSGIITFEEEIVLAPCAGYVYHEVKEGERIPVGKQLAVITETPLEEGDTLDTKDQDEGTGALQQTLNWFLYGNRNTAIAEARTVNDYISQDERVKIYSTLSGLLLNGVDGWEGFGPHTSFPYLPEEELENEEYAQQKIHSGEMINRFKPLFRIVNNYCWYYSTVLPPDIGNLVANNSSVRLYFPFEPDRYVVGEKVEAKMNYEHGGLEITWRINKAAGDFYNHRFSTAEVVYHQLEGILVPAGALVEVGGKKGVYLLEKGIVNFREVEILGHKEGFYLVKNLEVDEQIIENPSRMKVGQRYNW